MNSLVQSIAVTTTLALAFSSASASASAVASDAYIGLSRTTPGEAYATFSNGNTVENYNIPLALKLYGGMTVSDRYSVEIGYGSFGTYKVADPTPGSIEKFSLAAKMLYAAGKASMPLGDLWSVFGKLGLAVNRTSEEANAQPSVSRTFVRPMIGFGAEYAITKNISGVLEYNFYGTSGNFRQQKLELGAQYTF